MGIILDIQQEWLPVKRAQPAHDCVANHMLIALAYWWIQLSYYWYKSLPNSNITEQLSSHLLENFSQTLVGNKLVDHWDVVGASPVGAAPTTSSLKM